MAASTSWFLRRRAACAPWWLLVAATTGWAADSAPVTAGEGGRLVYQADARGDVVPDFSNCGYLGGGVAIPDAPVRVRLKPQAQGDDGARIQAAIDQTGKLAAGAGGLRGAVLLERGVFRVAGTLTLRTGVVLRGAGPAVSTGTTLIATGTKGRSLIKIGGEGKTIQARDERSRQPLLDSYVPVGTRRLRVAKPADFRPGDRVLLERPSTAAWIHALGMDAIKPRPGEPERTKPWRPGQFDLVFERTVSAVDSSSITLDAPVVMAMESSFGGGSVCRYQPGPRVEQAGVEQLRLCSEYKIGQETRDDAHAGNAMDFGLAADCWVRHVTCLHFVQGCFQTNGATRRLTVEDSASLDPVSQIIPSRRYAFGVRGQQVLVQRCYSRGGRHDFMTGNLTPGPNAFVDCLAEDTHADSGPHSGWSVGSLYDNVTCDNLLVQDRGYMGTGQGWAGANHMLWNCRGNIICQTPPTAHNWAIGCAGTKGREFIKGHTPATWVSWGAPVSPRSLYLRQLQDRLGANAVRAVASTEQLAGPLTDLLRRRFAEPQTATP